ncbi:MAG TPA: hypothetical protein VD994_06440 [Prosthecobacter sp.]|nr:hypothetical protein [Prosthecobacter sp.]
MPLFGDNKNVRFAIQDLLQNLAAIHNPGGAANIAALDQQRMYMRRLGEQDEKERMREKALQELLTMRRPEATSTQDLSVGATPPGSIPATLAKSPAGYAGELDRFKADAMPLLAKAAPGLAVERLFKEPEPWKNYREVGQNLYEMDPVTGRPRLAVSGQAPQRGTKAAFDTQTKTQAFVTEDQIAQSGGRYVPVPSGMKLESDGQGGFKFVSGDMAGTDGIGTTAAVQTDMQKALKMANEGYARLQGIRSQFKPEYQQLGTRWGSMFTAAKDKLGADVTVDDAQKLSEYTSYRADATDNLSKYIQEMTGAAMGVQEAQRLTKGIPNPGQGMFDGDSPIEFQAKLDSTMKRLGAVQARMAYALRHGLTQQAMFAIPLESMGSIIDQRGDDMAEELRAANPSASEEEINNSVRQRLKAEFGL